MRLYEILLLLLPKSFRAEYAGEIRAIHAARHRDTNRVLFWLEAVADVVVTAFGVHAEILAQDIKYAARTLHRSPGFTTTVVLVAALGIGATTAAFTMLDHVLLRPLPFPNSSELVDLYADVAGQHLRIELSPLNFRDWKRMSTSFRSMEAYTHISKNLIGQGDPERLIGAQVTGGLLSTLGIPPLFGRSFTEADDRETAAGTVLLSHRLWQTVFGADSGILGRKVLLDGEPYTVIGVMPASFLFPNRETEFWTPFRFNADAFADRTNTYLYGVGRLKPGVTIDSARAEMTLIAGATRAGVSEGQREDRRDAHTDAERFLAAIAHDGPCGFRRGRLCSPDRLYQSCQSVAGPIARAAARDGRAHGTRRGSGSTATPVAHRERSPRLRRGSAWRRSRVCCTAAVWQNSCRSACRLRRFLISTAGCCCSSFRLPR